MNNLKKELSIAYQLLFCYGILQSSRVAIAIINLFVLKGTPGVYVLCGTLDLLFLGYYVKVSLQQKNALQDSPANGIFIWGLLAAVIPLLMFAARMACFWLSGETANQGMEILAGNQDMLEMGLFCGAVILSGAVLKKRWMSPLGIFLLFLFLVCNVFIKLDMAGMGIDIFFVFLEPVGYLLLGGFYKVCCEKTGKDP